MYMLVAIAVTILVIALGLARYRRTHPGGRFVRPRSARPQRPARPTRTIAPDDDPEFLNEIDRKLRGEDKSG